MILQHSLVMTFLHNDWVPGLDMDNFVANERVFDNKAEHLF